MKNVSAVHQSNRSSPVWYKQAIVSHLHGHSNKPTTLEPLCSLPMEISRSYPATQSHTQVLQWAHIFPSSTSDGISTIQRAGGHCNVTRRLGLLQASEGRVPSCSSKRPQMANRTPLGGPWALSWASPTFLIILPPAKATEEKRRNWPDGRRAEARRVYLRTKRVIQFFFFLKKEFFA